MSGTSYGSWIGIKCRHPDGRIGTVTNEFIGRSWRELVISYGQGQVQANRIIVSGTEPNIGLGWEWQYTDHLDGTSRWIQFDD
jgi:hypothetical protein